MADPNEPEKETARIDLLPEPVAKPPDPNTKSRETVRIQLPLRKPSDKMPLSTPIGSPPASGPTAQDLISPRVFQPPPSSPVPAPAPVSPALDSLSSGPKKEIARIPLMPDPTSKPLPTVQMKKTQPLIAMPTTAPQSTSIAVAPAEENAMPLCWALLGVSAIILIIQIWTYFS